MSNKLDRFFRDKLDRPSPVEFDEAYWEQARELIDEDRNKRRRFIGWYWLFGLVLLVGLGAGFYFLQLPHTPSQPLSHKPEAANAIDPTSPAKELATPEPQVSSPANTATTNTTANNNTTSQNPSALSPASNDQNPTTNTNTTSINLNPQSEEQAKAPNATTATTIENKATAATTNAKSPITQPSKTDPKATSTLPQNDLSPNAISPQLEEVTSSPSTTNDSPLQNQNRVEIGTTNKAANPADELAKPSETSEAVVLSLFDPLTSSALAALPEPAGAEEEGMPEVELDPHVPESKWALGLTLVGEAYPAQANEQRLIGGGGGLSLRYRWLTQWSVQSDFLYEWRGGQFGNAGTVAERRYNFGLEEKVFELRPESLHYLNIPIYLQFKNGRQYLEAGLSMSYLIGARGELRENTFLQPWERSSNATMETKVETRVAESGWLDDSAFRTWRMGVLLGYRYELGKKWNLSLQAQYRLPSLVVDPENPKAILRESGPLQFRLGLSFFPFAK